MLRMSGPARTGIRVLDLSPAAARRVLLAAARRLRRRRAQGGGHGARRLHPLGAAARSTAWSRARPPRCSSRSTAASARLRLDLKVREGREVLLRLVREHDVLLESFRPGVLDRLGVGYERLREENPRPRLLRDHRLRPGGPGPRPARARHQLPRARRAARAERRAPAGRPCPPAGQIADLGGGALMAAFGDPRRAARARALRRGPARRRLDDARARRAGSRWSRRGSSPTAPCRGAASSSWPAGCRATGPTRAPTAGSRSARWSRSSGRRCAAGSAATTCSTARWTRPSPAELEAVFAARTRAEWAAFDDEHGCCLEPVLELDEALARAPEDVVEVDQPGAAAPVRLLGPPVALSRTPPRRHAARARRSAPTPTRCSPGSATTPSEIARAARRPARSPAPAACRRGASWHERPARA